MSAILILKSLHERRLTHQLIHSWLHENEMFITNKVYSPDQSTVEITFVDEERKQKFNPMKNHSLKVFLFSFRCRYDFGFVEHLL